jgi:hypothetical protein
MIRFPRVRVKMKAKAEAEVKVKVRERLPRKKATVKVLSLLVQTERPVLIRLFR